jgi:hypothetical protein
LFQSSVNTRSLDMKVPFLSPLNLLASLLSPEHSPLYFPFLALAFYSPET